MNFKKWAFVLVLAAAVTGFFACGGGGGGKYADMKPVVKDMIKATDKFVAEMEKADDAKKVAAALTDFSKTMKKIAPAMEKLEGKYPELKGMSDPPPELGELGPQLTNAMMKMGSVMMKVMQYADDPEVQKAQEEFENIMK